MPLKARYHAGAYVEGATNALLLDSTRHERVMALAKDLTHAHGERVARRKKARRPAQHLAENATPGDVTTVHNTIDESYRSFDG